ncbi:MAG: ABC transporter permease [Acidobacteriota bacterium]|nr:ABC transporter permease [Acidobacteriota bacterium]
MNVFRYAFRTLLKSPGFCALAVLTLGLGIAANTAIFSLFYQVLLRSLPVNQPERLVVFHVDKFGLPGNNSSDNSETVFSYPMYRALNSGIDAFQGIAIRTGTSAQLLVNGQAERVRTEVVSGNFFEVLGVRPQAGRLISPSDDRKGAGNAVAVLSYDYWLKRFGGGAAPLNQAVSISGAAFTIVGVAPEGFRGIMSGSSPEIYLPLSLIGAVDPNWSNYDRPSMSRFTILGRLAPGITRDRAQAELQPVFASAVRDELTELKVTSERNRQRLTGKRLELASAAQGLNELEHHWRKPLNALASMVGLLLLIGCANLANLLLARGAARSRETSIRLALGAGRGRIFSMLLAESFLVAVGGAAAALLLAPALTWGVLRLLPPDQTGGWLAGSVSAPVFIFCTLLMALTGLVSGIAPAWQSARTGASSVLGDRTAATGAGHLSPRVRQGLVAGQLALSLVLLSTAGLFGKSLINLMQHDPGFRAENVLTFSLDASEAGYTAERGLALYRNLLARFSALPDVSSVSLADATPFSGNESSTNVTIEGYNAADGEDMNADTNAVGPAFFRTLGTPLIAGREFTAGDNESGPKVAIINQAFVKRFLPNRNPIGLKMERGAGHPPDLEIVGVVPDMDNQTLREKVLPTYYLAFDQSNAKAKSFGATFLIRSGGDVDTLTSAVRALVAQNDRTLPVFDIITMEARVSNSIYSDRLLAALTTAFGLLAVILTAVGLYGVISYIVGRRIPEIGIRMALGATGASVARLVLQEVGILAGLGALAGTLGAFATTKAVQSMLYGLGGFDPLILAGTILILGAVALSAGAIPAWRAAKVQPLTALRHE